MRLLPLIALGCFAASAAFAQPAVAPSAAPDRLTSARSWLAPVGEVVAEGETLALRGAPGVEQAVVVWPGLGLDAATVGHATIRHRGFAPQHELSLYFRNAEGEHVVEVPRTQRRATIALGPAQGWRGTIVELGLVYGPAGNIPTLVGDNTLRVEAVELRPASASGRVAAAISQLAAIAPRIGSNINILRGRLAMLPGAVLLLALVAAAMLGGRARRAALAVALFAFVLAELALWRQWLVLHGDTGRIADARRAAGRPLDLDWQLVELAARVRAAIPGDAQRVGFLLSFDDPYVADRLKYHLLPLRAWRGVPAPTAPGLCLLELGDREVAAPLLREETAFGLVVLATPADARPECRWNSLPSPR